MDVLSRVIFPSMNTPSHIRSVAGTLLALAAATLLPADTTKVTTRSITPVAEGIYAIRHPDAPDGFPQGNTTVVIGDDAVLVVDSCYLPSSAREDIAQIKQWTNKPVRYLVNTHWHYDHQLGNGAYADAFPGLDIIAHTETRNQIRGMNPDKVAGYEILTARMKKTLDTGIRANGQALTPEVRAQIEPLYKGRVSIAEEFKSRPGRVPNVTFEKEFTVDLGHREVRVLHLGRGNTAGDVVVFVPQDRVLATGDLLDCPVPYVGGGYPTEQIATLQQLLQLDAAVTIPGHGDVLHGEAGAAHLKLFRDFLLEVTTRVSEAVYRIGIEPTDAEKVHAEVEKLVDFDAWRQKFAGDDKRAQNFFDGFTRPGVVQAAFAETWPR